MKYAIENKDGQWWTGECWGVIEARRLYPYEKVHDVIDDLISAESKNGAASTAKFKRVITLQEV